MTTSSSALPPLYAAWMESLLQAPVPAESNATCSACAMVVSEESGEPGFNPATKCCTFLPDIWNFLAGAVLLDDSPEAARGRATLEARIDARVAVTPLGLRRSPTYALLYGAGPQAFGQSRALRCPHYIDERGGLCGVWRHRESTCATWYCKFERGIVGREFWAQLHQLLRAAEESVSAWCLLELGVDGAALARMYPPHTRHHPPKITGRDLDADPSPADVQAVWGSWLGREREFYSACARLVAALTWNDVVRISGTELAIYARLTQDAFARHADVAAPQRPIGALVQITPRGDVARLATYSTMDMLEVPPVLATLLSEFDGRPLDESLAAIRERHGVVVGPSLVRKLTDFGILRDAARPAAS